MKIPIKIKEPEVIEDDRELSELLPEVGAEFSIDDTIAQMARDKLQFYNAIDTVGNVGNIGTTETEEEE